jgi:hypothetical protein
VAGVIADVLRADAPKLRHPIGFGAQAIARRAAMKDEDFIALGAMADPDYYAALKEQLDLDLEPET